jgi:acyl-CoA synthetase (AMP-forming)/AMP-acid ligase II
LSISCPKNPADELWSPSNLADRVVLQLCVPYDRLGRGQLRTPEHNYLAYREKFAQKQANVEQQKLCAWVCLRDGEAASIEEIRSFCQGKIAHYKIPRDGKFVDGFPRMSPARSRSF